MSGSSYYTTIFRGRMASSAYKGLQAPYRYDPGSLVGTTDPTIPFLPLESATVAPPSTAGYVKVWDGSAWNLKPVKVWDGTSWNIKPAKYWSGTAWITT